MSKLMELVGKYACEVETNIYQSDFTLKEIQAIADSMEWISVKDRLPDEDIKEVLLWESMQERYIHASLQGQWGKMFSEEPQITHWMPLPNPPVKER